MLHADIFKKMILLKNYTDFDQGFSTKLEIKTQNIGIDFPTQIKFSIEATTISGVSIIQNYTLNN